MTIGKPAANQRHFPDVSSAAVPVLSLMKWKLCVKIKCLNDTEKCYCEYTATVMQSKIARKFIHILVTLLIRHSDREPADELHNQHSHTRGKGVTASSLC